MIEYIRKVGGSMIAFVKGKVFSTSNDSLVLDNQGIGYRIYTAFPQQYRLGDELLLLTYQHVREDAIALYGFATQDQYDLFLRLIDVKGMGCKSALNVLANSSVSMLVNAIESGDVAYLKSMPGIGAKTAQQIVLDLKGKLVMHEENNTDEMSDDLVDAKDALIALGYKASEVRSVLKEVMKQDYKNTDGAIRLALSMFMKRK